MYNVKDRFFAAPKEKIARLSGENFVLQGDRLVYSYGTNKKITLTDYLLPELVVTNGGSTFIGGTIGTQAHVEGYSGIDLLVLNNALDLASEYEY